MYRHFFGSLCAALASAAVIGASLGALPMAATDTVRADEIKPPSCDEAVLSGSFTCGTDDFGVDNDEMFSTYVGRLFGIDSGAFYSTGFRTARSFLTGDEARVYDALAGLIKEIAGGERTSSFITVGAENWYMYGLPEPDATAAFGDLAGEFDAQVLLSALVADFPYELYWFDKEIGVSVDMYTDTHTGVICYLLLGFEVADSYEADGSYTVNPDKVVLAKKAADNAAAVVAEFAELNDYNKLSAYKDRICELVTYDSKAAAGQYFSTEIDPWQLVYVFDGDDATNVVCEGYSKAFQYLCDSSEFSDGATQCFTVAGDMFGGSGGGRHMWNIVTMPDGRNYLADITNSDVGTIGEDGSLYLSGAPKTARTFSVSFSDGTTGTVELECYAFYPLGCEVLYIYDSDTKELWGDGEDSILDLAETVYSVPILPTGDVDGNGRTNPVDLVYIQRYLAKWSGYGDAEIDPKLFDFDGDGEATTDDAVRLARHLAKWIGYETLVQ